MGSILLFLISDFYFSHEHQKTEDIIFFSWFWRMSNTCSHLPSSTHQPQYGSLWATHDWQSCFRWQAWTGTFTIWTTTNNKTVRIQQECSIDRSESKSTLQKPATIQHASSNDVITFQSWKQQPSSFLQSIVFTLEWSDLHKACGSSGINSRKLQRSQ